MPTRREFLTQTTAAGVLAAASTRVAQAIAKEAPPASVTQMKTYRIPHTDLTVSRLAFGCAMLGIDWESPEFLTKTVQMIHFSYDQGITFFDMADVYGWGKAEQAMGEVLKKGPGLRNKIVIQTKCGDRFRDGGIVDNSYRHIVSSAEGSLRRLDTDHLDILLLHWPDSLVEADEVAKAFDELKRSGKVRHFGVSNHSPYQIEILKKSVRQPLVVNQIQLGLAYWYVPSDFSKARFNHGAEGVTTLDYCRAHDIQVQAYSPLRGTSNLGTPPNLLSPPQNAAPEVKQAAQLLSQIAQKHGVSSAAVMFAWLLRHPAGIVPIVGAIKPEHIIENCKADRVELSREEWYSLLNAAAAMRSQKAA